MSSWFEAPPRLRIWLIPIAPTKGGRMRGTRIRALSADLPGKSHFAERKARGSAEQDGEQGREARNQQRADEACRKGGILEDHLDVMEREPTVSADESPPDGQPDRVQQRGPDHDEQRDKQNSLAPRAAFHGRGV